MAVRKTAKRLLSQVPGSQKQFLKNILSSSAPLQYTSGFLAHLSSEGVI